MQDEKIKNLEDEIARLQKQLDALQDSSFKHFDMFTTHLVEQDREIADLYTYLMPILKKTYPGYTPTKQHLDATLNRATARKGDDPDKKSP